jgi:exodeoxyribonuclease-5
MNNQVPNSIRYRIKFAYAVTCHKSQGGQWPVVFVDHGWFDEDKMTPEDNYEFIRWLYTAVTRATEKLYLVNFKKSLLSFVADSHKLDIAKCL